MITNGFQLLRQGLGHCTQDFESSKGASWVLAAGHPKICESQLFRVLVKYIGFRV